MTKINIEIKITGNIELFVTDENGWCEERIHDAAHFLFVRLRNECVALKSNK